MSAPKMFPCGAHGCRRRLRVFDWCEETPKSDGWSCLWSRLREEIYFCPIHSLTLFDYGSLTYAAEVASLKAQLEQVTKERDEASKNEGRLREMLAAEEGKNDDLRAQLAASEAGAAALREAAKLCLADDADGPVLAARLLALEAALNSSSAGTGWVRAEVVDEGRRLVAYAECSHCGKKYGDPTDCIEAHCIEAHAWLAALAPLKAK